MAHLNTDGPVHATAVAVGGRGLLILGAAGRGKSGLALQLIATGARLISDDRVLISPEGRALVLSAPAAIAGRIEARGIGILGAPCEPAPLHTIVDLDRAPDARWMQNETMTAAGNEFPLIRGRDVPNLCAALLLLLEHGRADDNTSS